ncbi:voltage-gated potassium channel [Gloeophyllum trabeum ATCC 11539]|uniref:Voltage-gated potassium channel n=1 Tax=Gloeophyllum trabeum (strain ATCC 11539 / FP-39264 / Madison 617) TaxID=670483 RepID=S7RHC1_GLOTA|nr:voltage-gated potassium channel [Gloeophyllum trabeum ATCC 11539]EPQ53675.1 voltage-gated potassium channel [Gloeophyllum trabeum ATCC 11539]
MLSVPLIAALHVVWDKLVTHGEASNDPEKRPQLEEKGRRGTEEGDDADGNCGENTLEGDSQNTERTGTFVSLASSSKTPASWWSKFKAILFPPYDLGSPSNIDQYVPNYRSTPILAGIVIPFSILLEIPGLTDYWYIRTMNHHTVDYRSNPSILVAGLCISMASGIIANLCLIMRFLEKRVKSMTILCVVFLTIHDVINIVAVTIFGVAHRYDDGFTYGQAFWMTVCSTIASVVTNVTLIADVVRTKDFAKSGSGLTAKQRALVLIVMILLLQIALGSAVNSKLNHLTFLDGLYFTVCSLETIGFGDITPISTGARVWICAYSTVGIINLGVAVGMARETVIEGLEVSYRKRASQLRAFRRSEREKRKAIVRWKASVEQKLEGLGIPAWIPDKDDATRQETDETGLRTKVFLVKALGGMGWTHRFLDLLHVHAHHQPGYDAMHSYARPGYRLNIEALTPAHLEACALEAGVPLDMVLPDVQGRRRGKHGARGGSESQQPDHADLSSIKDRRPHDRTHVQIGQMAEMMTRFAVGVLGAHFFNQGQSNESPIEEAREAESERAEGGRLHQTHNGEDRVKNAKDRVARTVKMKDWRALEENSIYGTYDSFKATLESEEKKAFITKLTIVWSIFFIFWMVGSAIFSRTERWPFGTAMYFSFTTIGYGDYSPRSPAGRAIFVVWALLGVATMTILISVISDAYGSRYKSAMHTPIFNKVVKRYRERARHEPGPPQPALRPVTPSGQPMRPRSETLEESRARAQRQLEELPHKILQDTRTFHENIQYFLNTTARDMIAGDSAAGGAGAGSAELQPPEGLKKLLDDIAAAEGIGDGVKSQILQDEDARNTLFMLSVEKSLRKMIGAAEGALQALAERDLLAADQNRMDETDPPSSHSEVQELPR